MRVLIVGMDGLAPTTMRWLTDGGVMPNLGEMIAKGASGILRSTIPPYTPQAWTSMVTGVNPGRHGVFGFTRWTDEGKEVLTSSTDCKVKSIWDVLSDDNRSSIVMNVPVTYPPRPISGVMVSGMGTPPNAGDFTYPPAIKETINRLAGDYVTDVAVSHDATSSRRGARVAALAIEKALARRFLVTSHLLNEHPWEFAMVVLEAPDRIQHLFWKLLDEKAPPSDARDQALAIYRRLDEGLGKLIGDVDDGSPLTVLVVSDHGFQNLDWTLYLNHVLKTHGLARLKRKPTLRSISRLAPRSVRHMGARVLGKVSPETLRASVLSGLDWNRSIAFAGRVFEQGVYVRKTGDPSTDLANREHVERVLLGIQAPDGSGPAIERVVRKEEIYSGRWIADAPDLFPIFRLSGVMIVPGFGDGKNAWGRVTLPHGTHEEAGIIVATGPGIRPGSNASAEIHDVAPTVLKLLGGPLPRGLDGVPIAALGGPDVHETDIDVEREDSSENVYSEEDEQALVERLRGLGYID